ncbi:AMP-binding protein, partial [Parasphingorhabdus sp.]
TAMPGVPTMYQALLDHPDIDKTDFSSLKVCVSGGAPLPMELKKKFEGKTGAKLVEGYGLTESCGVVSANPYEGLNKPGTIGQPAPGTLVKLVDKADPKKPAPKGEPGELIFSGPQVMQGYWNLPKEDEKVFVDGFLRTGDVATIDEDGYIKIVDRLKDMIAVGGFKVFPSQVEEVLYKHEAVKEALVIGVSDAYRGESPKAYVALEPGMTITGEELKDWLNPQLGKHERVVDVVIHDSLPKTMIGKLDRKALRKEELG